MTCRTPFAHDPQSCDCGPSEAEVALRLASANAKIREAQSTKDAWTLVLVGVVTFTVSLTALAVAAHWGLGRVEAEFQQQSRV